MLMMSSGLFVTSLFLLPGIPRDQPGQARWGMVQKVTKTQVLRNPFSYSFFFTAEEILLLICPRYYDKFGLQKRRKNICEPYISKLSIL